MQTQKQGTTVYSDLTFEVAFAPLLTHAVKEKQNIIRPV